MTDLALQKEMTRKVVISDPNEELLQTKLAGRTIAPELFRFLKNLVKTRKWTKNITVPSTHDNVAVALLFTSSLKEAGLEILSEIHVFYCGRTYVEVWEMLQETEHPTSLPPGIFSSVDVGKVRVSGTLVNVEMRVHQSDGIKNRVLKTYDFAEEEPTVRTRPLADGEAVG
jgi:hypothetical protein